MSWHRASPIPLLRLHLSLSRVGSDQAAGKQAGRVHYEKREVVQHLHFTHTPSGDVIMLHYTCPSPEAVHWASPRGRPQHWYVKGHVPPCRRKKEKSLRGAIY